MDRSRGARLVFGGPPHSCRRVQSLPEPDGGRSTRRHDAPRPWRGAECRVGAQLGPSYYYQRRFFEAKDNTVSTKDTLLRYDLEVSGFPSSHCGHLVLLRLKDQDFPGTRQIEDWPTWD